MVNKSFGINRWNESKVPRDDEGKELRDQANGRVLNPNTTPPGTVQANGYLFIMALEDLHDDIKS